MNIQKSTQAYEAWLAERTTLVPADLAFKHTQMAADPFLRPTFHRWAQIFPKTCPELIRAPTLLADSLRYHAEAPSVGLLDSYIAGEAMVEATERDWKEWKKAGS